MAKQKPDWRAINLEVDPAEIPLTVGNPDAADELSIDQSHLEEFVANAGESSIVECRRPPKGIFLPCGRK
jgi:hypothetical protein